MSPFVISGSCFASLQTRVLQTAPHFEGTIVEPHSIDSTALLMSFVEKWEQARIRREARKKRSSRESLRTFHVPSYAELGRSIASDLEPLARKGLLGEIVSQILFSDCCLQVKIRYVNWEHTGSANRYGIDLVGFVDDDLVVLVESKFCGGQDHPLSYLVQRIRQGLSYLEDSSEFEIKLSDVYFRMLLSSSSTGSLPGPVAAKRLRECLEAGNYLDFVSAPFSTVGVNMNDILDPSKYDPPSRTAMFTTINLINQKTLLTHL